jgi:hypothetical protein
MKLAKESKALKEKLKRQSSSCKTQKDLKEVLKKRDIYFLDLLANYYVSG